MEGFYNVNDVLEVPTDIVFIRRMHYTLSVLSRIEIQIVVKEVGYHGPMTCRFYYKSSYKYPLRVERVFC